MYTCPKCQSPMHWSGDHDDGTKSWGEYYCSNEECGTRLDYHIGGGTDEEGSQYKCPVCESHMEDCSNELDEDYHHCHNCHSSITVGAMLEEDEEIEESQ